jgi:hypothetical protein
MYVLLKDGGKGKAPLDDGIIFKKLQQHQYDTTTS